MNDLVASPVGGGGDTSDEVAGTEAGGSGAGEGCSGAGVVTEVVEVEVVAAGAGVGVGLGCGKNWHIVNKKKTFRNGQWSHLGDH